MISKKTAKKPLRGFKATNSDMICRNHKFELGKIYSVSRALKEIEPCKNGFHFCEDILEVLHHYDFDPSEGENRNRFFEVEGFGVFKRDTSKAKIAVESIKLVRELSKKEICDKLYIHEGKEIFCEIDFGEKWGGTSEIVPDYIRKDKSKLRFEDAGFIGFSRKLSKKEYALNPSRWTLVRLERPANFEKIDLASSTVGYRIRFVRFANTLELKKLK